MPSGTNNWDVETYRNKLEKEHTYGEPNAHDKTNHRYDIEIDIPKHHESAHLTNNACNGQHKHNSCFGIRNKHNSDQKDYDSTNSQTFNST